MKGSGKRSRKVCAGILVLMMVFGVVFGSMPPQGTARAEALNLAQNPGFESGTTAPSNWSVYMGTMVWDNVEKYEGTRSVRFTLTADGQRSILDQQYIPITSGGTYQLSSYYKTGSWTGTATLELYLFDANKTYITGQYYTKTLVKGDQDWDKITIDGVKAPVNAKYARIRLNAMKDSSTGKGTGNVWFDNVEFIQVVNEGPQDLGTVTVNCDNTSLLVGDTVSATVSGILNDGTPADLSTAGVTWSSDNQLVATVASNGTITAIGPGTAVIKAAVTLNGITKQGAKTITVTGEAQSYKYTFRYPESATIQADGWRVAPGQTVAYRDQVYGTQVQSNNLGDKFSIEFNVQQTGYYQVKLNGAGSSGGSIVNVLVDNQKVGEYDFYLASYQQVKGQVSMATMELSQGIHTLTLEAIGHTSGSWGYNMYPGELELQKKRSLPVLTSVSLAASRSELMAGQTAKITVSGVMEDGYTLNLSNTTSAVKVFSSADESIATVDQNGVVLARKPGTVAINAAVTLGGVTKEGTIQLTVNDKVLDSIQLTAGKTPLPIGQTTGLTVKGMLADGTEVDISDAIKSFSTSDAQIATVDSKGIITGVEKGNVTIHVDITLGDVTKSADLQLRVVGAQLETVTMKLDRTTIFVGDKLKPILTAVLNDGKQADLSNAVIEYESSNTGVAVINNGAIEIAGAGNATITAKVTLDDITKTASLDIAAQAVSNSKTRTTYYTDAKVSAARQNIEKYNWAKSARDAAVASADKYVALGYDTIWNLVTAQSLPRSYGVNQAMGCPNCGTAINAFGNYPYLADPINAPWKLECPNCHMKFPTNDFGAYYKSGLDEHGIFNPANADKSLLKNTLYPEKGEKWGVDDGYGYVDANGKKYTFIAYYNHWFLWYGKTTGPAVIEDALNSLKNAYIYTGDLRYARAGIVLLDRIADVYPAMDTSAYPTSQGYLNSDGGTGLGKVIGSIWETTLAKEFASAYDAFYPAMDDQEVISFLSGKADQYNLSVLKRSATGIRRNIEDGIFRQIYPGIKSARIRGNNGMHQSALAMAAVVLDSMPETKEWLDFNFQAGGLVSGPYRVTGGNILATMVNDVDRDGHGSEAAPGYNRLWLSQYIEVANILDGYDLYPAADLYKNVKFRKMFSAMYPLLLSDIYSALIGDSGSTGSPINYLNKSEYIKAFEKFGDPVFAQVVYFLNGNQVGGVHGDIFSADPLKVATDMENAIATYGPLKLDSTNLTGYGFTALRDGENIKITYGIATNFPEMDIVSSTDAYKVYDTNGALQLETPADATAIGHNITFKFNVPEAKNYEIDIKPYKAASYGIYNVKIDGNLAGQMDFYGSTSEYEVLTKMDLAAGEHTITFECVGKNNASSGYKLGLVQFALLDEATQERRDLSNNSNTLRDLWMYYGNNGGHGHKDTLNMGLHAYGLDLSPDLGYPEYADSEDGHRYEWVENTISHNTVMVDGTKQKTQTVAEPKHYDASDMVQLIDVEAPKVYPQTELYKRTTALIKVDGENSYAVDFFRVKGGNDHYFSFHGAEGTVTTEGLNLTAQLTGTYAGPDVEFPTVSKYAGASSYTGNGFRWLKNVERDQDPAQMFSVDWDVTDTWNVLKQPADIHLRMTMMGDFGDAALADGVPPRNKPGNPASLRYLIVHNNGQNLDSLFTSVIEPYKADRYIESISPVDLKVDGQVVNCNTAKAVKVVLKNGRVDYIVSALDNTITYTVDDKFQFKGFFGVYSEKDGNQVYAYVNDGTMVGDAIKDATSALTGTVVDFTRDMSIQNEITVQLDGQGFDAEDLVGRYVYVKNDGVRNASYEIKGIKSVDGNKVTLDIGDTTTIRKWADAADFSKGFIYDIAQGAAFTIPLSVECKVVLSEASLTADKEGLTRNGTANLTVAGKLNTGIAADLTSAEIEYVSSNPEIVSVENGVVTAHNSGSANVYAEVTLDGTTVRTNEITFNVTVSIESIRALIEAYKESGELSGPLVPQLTNSLDQAEHQLGKGDKDKAAKHMEDFVKHLENMAHDSNISEAAKNVLDADAKALINLWTAE